jgi:signal transduction histidine kinase
VSIRLRLALLYAALTSAVVASIVIAAYTVHNRNAYEDVDRALVNAAEHFRLELTADRLSSGAGPLPVSALGDSTVLARLYDRDGEVLDMSPSVPAPPPIDVKEVLRADEGPAFDAVLRWLPGGEVSDEGAFATERDPSSGGRIRLYAFPVAGPEGAGGFVQTWTSLASLDKSMRTFRLLMAGLGGGGVLAVWIGSLLLAGGALRPIATMTRTARAIAVSRGFSRRLPEPKGRDELQQLARTFNEMLASLEEAYRTQQRFVADASHELRAPLTAIQGNIELLARIQEMPPEERAEAVSHLEREVGRLSRMVGELLTLARADAGQAIERRPVELDAVLLEAVAEMGSAPGRPRIEIEAVEPLLVEGDSDRLKQLILILLDNALKYTPGAGEIRAALRREDHDGLLHVADNGVGIPPDDLPRIFERFYRADPARSRDPGGTGLGLAIAKWIVDQHEGDITVDSAVGSGTSVSVRFSLLVPPEPASAPESGAEAPVTRQEPQ